MATTEIEMVGYETEITNLIQERAKAVGLELSISSNRGLNRFEIRHPKMKYHLFETIHFPEVVGFLAGYGLRPEADKYEKIDSIFSDTELRGFEKSYNFISDIKLKKLSEGLIGVVRINSGKIDWLKVNTETRKEIEEK